MERTSTKRQGRRILDPQRAAQKHDGHSPRCRIPSTDNRDAAVTKRTRCRTGCLNCRRRRKKCDENKPACSKCHSRGEKCEWDTSLTFRHAGLGIGHSSIRQPREQNSRSIFPAGPQLETLQTKIHNSLEDPPNQGYGEVVETALDASKLHGKGLVDDGGHEHGRTLRIVSPAPDQQLPLAWHETGANLDIFASSRRHHVQEPPAESNDMAGSSRDQEPGANVVNGGNTDSQINYVLQSSPQTLLDNDCPRIIAPLGQTPRHAISDSIHTDRGTHIVRGPASLPDRTAQNRGAFNSALGATPNTGQYALFDANKEDSSQTKIAPENAATELEALDYLLFNPRKDNLFTSATNQDGDISWPPATNHEFPPVDQITPESPDAYATYYPNPAYKELHTVLHYHMVETARSTALTRQGTPGTTTECLSTMRKDLLTNQEPDRGIFWEPASLISPSQDNVLTSRRELEIWQNYLQEVAVWLDMFDMERHFQLKIPLMAKTSDHLRYSILALSARQMERKEPDKPYTESLTLYQKAIELIVQELRSLDTAVIASCVLLCVLEMMSSSPLAWAKHLDGCAMMLQAAGINGTVGGVGQALFWCFARMDVWGGFLSDTLTKIPTSHWFIPSASMSVAVSRFKSSSRSFDSYANYAVFLCASVVNVLSDQNPTFAGKSENLSDIKASNCSRWKALFNLLEDWYNSRPEEMRPLMLHPAPLDDHQHPFPIVLYGTSPAVNGNQLYHASAILMLQGKPKAIRLGKGQKSILWHARQICGIAASNDNHGPWINALQPLWIAGKVMSHPTEHQIILNLLARIEKETGWATSWLAEDLREYWGDPEE